MSNRNQIIERCDDRKFDAGSPQKMRTSLLPRLIYYAFSVQLILLQNGCTRNNIEIQDTFAAQKAIVTDSVSDTDAWPEYRKLIGLPAVEDPKLYISAANNLSISVTKRKMAKALFFKRCVKPPTSLRILVRDYPDIKSWFSESELLDNSNVEQSPLGPDTLGMSLYTIGDDGMAPRIVVWIALSRQIEKAELCEDIRRDQLPNDLLIMSLEIQ